MPSRANGCDDRKTVLPGHRRARSPASRRADSRPGAWSHAVSRACTGGGGIGGSVGATVSTSDTTGAGVVARHERAVAELTDVVLAPAQHAIVERDDARGVEVVRERARRRHRQRAPAQPVEAEVTVRVDLADVARSEPSRARLRRHAHDALPLRRPRPSTRRRRSCAARRSPRPVHEHVECVVDPVRATRRFVFSPAPHRAVGLHRARRRPRSTTRPRRGARGTSASARLAVVPARDGAGVANEAGPLPEDPASVRPCKHRHHLREAHAVALAAGGGLSASPQHVQSPPRSCAHAIGTLDAIDTAMAPVTFGTTTGVATSAAPPAPSIPCSPLPHARSVPSSRSANAVRELTPSAIGRGRDGLAGAGAGAGGGAGASWPPLHAIITITAAIDARHTMHSRIRGDDPVRSIRDGRRQHGRGRRRSVTAAERALPRLRGSARR